MAIVFNNDRISTDRMVCYIDAANPKSYSVNVHPRPTDPFAWAQPGGANVMTLSRATGVISPVGNTPMQIVTTGTSGYIGTYNNSTWNLAPAANGDTWTFSFWVKGASSTSFQGSLMIFEANSSGNYTNLGQTYYNITNNWTRVSGSYTMNQASTAFVQVRIDCYVNGQTFWVDGLQVERSSSASAFNPLTNTNGVNMFDLSGNGRTFTSTAGSVRPGFSGTTAGGVITITPGAQYRNTAIDLRTSPYTVIGAARYTGGTTGRIIEAPGNNWLLGHWSSSTLNHFAMGWVTSAGAGPNDTNWRIYAATGNKAQDNWSFYVNGDGNTLNSNGGDEGPNGLGIGTNGETSNSQFSFLMAYDRILSAIEIKNIFNTFRGRYSI